MNQPCCTSGVACRGLLSCTQAGHCEQGLTVNDLSVVLHTLDEDKDDNTGVRVAIDGLSSWSQTTDTHYDDQSTHTFPLSPTGARVSDLVGRYASICMQPHGNDTWKFDLILRGNRSDGEPFHFERDNVFLSTDVPCLSWDVTPAASPRGKIQVRGQCLGIGTVTGTGKNVVLQPCADGAAQDWLLVPEVSAPRDDGARIGRIRSSGGGCLGRVDLSSRSTLVFLQACNGSIGQRWKWSGNPSLITGPLARCLDASVAGTPGGTLAYFSCGASDAEAFTLPTCGGVGQACCADALPCRGAASCVKGTCADGGNVRNLVATMETTNEDKDGDTGVTIRGIGSFTSSGDSHFDDWSTNVEPLIPNSLPLFRFPDGRFQLKSFPNGHDDWKLNFIVQGVRDDGARWSFRRDNVWLTTNPENASTSILWPLRPPLDLVWKDVDSNGLPINPVWNGFTGGEFLSLSKECPPHPSPLVSRNLCLPPPFPPNCTGGTATDYGRCTSQAPTYDRSWLCGWHANWFPVTFRAKVVAGGDKNPPFPRADDDYHIDLRPNDAASNLGRPSIIAEFDTDETTEHFAASFWTQTDDLTKLITENDAEIMGLAGIDEEHGPHFELHPVYSFAMRLGGSSSASDRWPIFVRNWGNEGACGGSQHYLPLTQITLRFPAPPGAEHATAVTEEPQTEFDGGTESGDAIQGLKRTQLSPLQRDAGGTFVEMTFFLGPPDAHSFIDGSLTMTWMCGSSTCPQGRPADAARWRVRKLEVEKSLLPGGKLLTAAQRQQLQAKFAHLPSRPTSIRPVPQVPFTPPGPPLLIPGTGALSSRTAPNRALLDRQIAAQRALCGMLPKAKRPAVCAQLR